MPRVMKSVLKFAAKFAALAALGIAVLLPTLPSADAQTRKRTTITVRPAERIPGVDWYDPLRWRVPTAAEQRAFSRYTRRCSDWYALERRPSGTVLTPQMRCAWVRR